MTEERPSSLNPMDLQKSSVSSNENSQEDETMLELPSPISRHGSLVGEPQLPVPMEFLDVSSNIKKYYSATKQKFRLKIFHNQSY